MFSQSASPARPQEGTVNAPWPKTGQDWQLGRLEMARLADAGCSRHTTLLRKILAPRVLTGMGVPSPYPDVLGHLAEGAQSWPSVCLTDERFCFFS